MKICVIGTGYVGLVGSAVFAEWGNDVVGVDNVKAKIDSINKGEMPIYEPGLPELVAKNIKAKRLKFTTDLKKSVKEAEVIFVCVGTPSSQSGAADLSAVWQVAKDIALALDGYKVVVIKSTVPVGTNEEVERIISENVPKGAKFDVVSCPEFLREGYSIYDSFNTDRTVIGSKSQKAINKVKSIYAHLNSHIVECDLRSSEMIKYASNAFLATKISFINEIAQICERAGADVKKVAEGMGFDKRIGRHFLNAGLGYGGSCFPKDVEALYRTSTDQAYDFRLLRGVMDVNEMQKNYFVNKVKKYFQGNLVGKTVACFGLAFKENTDDIRKSVSIEVVKLLRSEGAKQNAFDPVATKNAKRELGNVGIEYFDDPYLAVKNADALCILTEWKEFAELDYAKIGKLLKNKVVFDGRNLLEPKALRDLGFTYFGVGRESNGWSYLNKGNGIAQGGAIFKKKA